MMFRLSCFGLGLFQTANGLAMILAPGRWFVSAPGAAATGPFNSHFVIDVGLGFLAAGLTFFVCAWRPRLKLVALGASGFVALHALFHLSHLMAGHGSGALVDIAIALPAFLGVALVWPRREIAA